MSELALRIARKGPVFYDNWVRRIAERHVQAINANWRLWGRDTQKQPEGDWSTWLMLAGRGFGKTRAGAEWVTERAMAGDGDTRIALVGGTGDEVRRVMIEGESGLLGVGLVQERPHWEPSLGRLIWPNGAQAAVYGGSNPDALRGPQHHFAWCDELAKWAYPQASWDNLKLGLRLGDVPRTLVTTTPRPLLLLRALLDDPAVVVTRGAMAENVQLPVNFIRDVTVRFGGTRLGRQELEGELIEEAEGALWTRAVIEACRVAAMPEVRRVVIGVDPPAGTASGEGGDACGIVVAALGRDEQFYIIEDASAQGLSPEGWARAVARAAARHGADRVVAEANNGGAMVASVLRAADAGVPVKLVHATRGKSARAEPVALLYERGLVKHLGAFPDLEDELCGLITGGGYEGPGRSPDRADALVWAVTALMPMRGRKGPRVSRP